MLRQERGENIETVRKNRMYEVPCTVLSAWWHWLRQQRKCFVHSTYLCLPCFVSASSPFPFPVLLVSRRSFPYLRCKVLSSVDPSLVLYLTSQPCSPQTAGTNQDVRQDKKNGPSHDAVNMKWRKKKKKRGRRWPWFPVVCLVTFREASALVKKRAAPSFLLQYVRIRMLHDIALCAGRFKCFSLSFHHSNGAGWNLYCPMRKSEFFRPSYPPLTLKRMFVKTVSRCLPVKYFIRCLTSRPGLQSYTACLSCSMTRPRTSINWKAPGRMPRNVPRRHGS